MTDLNPLTGKLYLEALHMTRVAREAYVLLAGKYPHPETIIPGGVTTTITTTTFSEFYLKIARFFDYAKKCVGIWNNVFDFFYAREPRFRERGAFPATMIDLGQWDHEDHYDATYSNCNVWGEKRWSTPGVLLDGRLVTTRLQDIRLASKVIAETNRSTRSPTPGQRAAGRRLRRRRAGRQGAGRPCRGQPGVEAIRALASRISGLARAVPAAATASRSGDQRTRPY